MTLSWHVQNFVVIGRVRFKPELCKIWLNFKFDRNTISGTGARSHWWLLRQESKSHRGIMSTWLPSHEVCKDKVNILATGALAPCVARSSAAMVLILCHHLQAYCRSATRLLLSFWQHIYRENHGILMAWFLHVGLHTMFYKKLLMFVMSLMKRISLFIIQTKLLIYAPWT